MIEFFIVLTFVFLCVGLSILYQKYIEKYIVPTDKDHIAFLDVEKRKINELENQLSLIRKNLKDINEILKNKD